MYKGSVMIITKFKPKFYSRAGHFPENSPLCFIKLKKKYWCCTPHLPEEKLKHFRGNDGIEPSVQASILSSIYSPLVRTEKQVIDFWLILRSAYLGHISFIYSHLNSSLSVYQKRMTTSEMRMMSFGECGTSRRLSK